MLGLIAALWLSLAPPAGAPDSTEPAAFDEVVEIEVVEIETPELAPELEPELAPEPAPQPERAPDPPPSSRSPSSPARPSFGQSQPWPGKWRSWGAPLISTLVPGFGQITNGQALKGMGMFFGVAGGLVGALVLYRDRSDGTRPLGREYARLTTYGILSTGLPLLWISAIADAYVVANEVEVEPEIEHRVRLTIARTMTVGFRADPDRPGFYDEWTGALMGQVARRWSVGVSDMAIKFNQGRFDVMQAGVQVEYRMFDRRRLWIDVALGSALQVKLRQGFAGLDPEGPPLYTKSRFGAVPHAQIDLRWFVLDRLSLDLIPRLSVPLTTRYFSANRALPRFAPTLELGASASAYF